VLVITLEDSLDELRRRVRAAMLHHGVSADEIQDHLFLWAPIGLKVAEQQTGSRTVNPGELERQIRAAVTEKTIDVVVLDPLVKAHSCDENDNGAIDQVAVILMRLATELNIALDVLQHERKGAGEAGDADRGRGASSFRDAGRLIYTITNMTDAERDQFGITEAERRSLIRIDSAKVNIAPPSIEARWFRIVGVRLGNGTDLYPNGDEIPTVEVWRPPDLWGEISTAVANDILDQLDRGTSDGQRYSAAKQAGEKISAWRLVQAQRPTLTEKQCQTVIATWLKNGILESRDYDDPVRRGSRPGLFVAKRPG
jgi:AAA domain